MTTPHHHPGPADAPAAEPGSLRCPECGTPAQPVAPRDWPLSGFAPRPATSHLDGTALCPVYGPHGAQPAEPVCVPAGFTIEQGWLINPDWTEADHPARADDEGHDTDPAENIDPSPVAHCQSAPPGVPPDEPGPARVYVVAGGDLVAAFNNPDAAVIQRTVMQAANLDTITSVMTPAQWATARGVLRAEHPEIVITDVTGYPA